jgi:hypothetical protein
MRIVVPSLAGEWRHALFTRAALTAEPSPNGRHLREIVLCEGAII